MAVAPPPAILARGPVGSRRACVPPGARIPSSRRRARPRPPMRPWTPCAAAVHPATTGWPPACTTSPPPTMGWSSSCSRPAGRCDWSPTPPRRRCRPCAWSATPTAAGWPAAEPRGWPPGRDAGRWAPGAPSRWTRTRPTPWPASSRRSGRWCRERLSVEALVGNPEGMVLLVGQAWLAPGAEVTPDPEHDQFAWWPADVDGLAGRGRRAAAAAGADALAPAPDEVRHLPPAGGGLVLPLGGLSRPCWSVRFVLGNPQPETFILGLAHGLLWIGMSLVCIAAARCG